VLALLGLVPACAAPKHDGRFSLSAAADPVAEAAAVLRDAGRLEGALQRAWPGFSLGSQVLMIHVPGGGLVMSGDPAPPAGFEPLRRGGAFVLRGPAPDSLSGIKTALAWRGRTAAGTLVPYHSPGTLGLLVHEAFHTHQHRLASAGTFRLGMGDTGITSDISREALTILQLENRGLARALLARSDDEARREVLTTLALRTRRCGLMPRNVCARERALERTEGSARFVEWHAIQASRRLGTAEVMDTLRRDLFALADIRQLARFHFYDRGHAWLRLLERLGPRDWRDRIGTSSPDTLLGLRVGFVRNHADSLATAALRSAEAQEAADEAAAILARWAARRDSIVRAFHAQPGIPVRIRSATFPNRGVSDPEAQSVDVPADGGNKHSYAVALRESRMWLGSDSTWVRLRQAARITCCERFEITVIVPREGAYVTVGGERSQVQRSGGSRSGRIAVSSATLDLEAPRGDVTFHGDSVTIALP
jgi:hypothetical protein